MKPMLAESIELHEIDRYVKDPSWVANQKLDGDRLLICITDGKIEVLNREGEPRRNAVPRQIHATWKPQGIRVLPIATTVDEKRKLLRTVERISGEGLMFKRVDGLYRPGRRSRDMVKAKFTTTCDAVVTAIGVDGHNNCHYSVFDGTQLREIGSCSLNGKPAVVIGDVIELRYLYASDDDRLYQPRMLRVRRDKTPQSCTIDQLKYTNREVMITRKPCPACGSTRVERTVATVDHDQERVIVQCFSCGRRRYTYTRQRHSDPESPYAEEPRRTLAVQGERNR
jgi:ATP-dependent DNA ligase